MIEDTQVYPLLVLAAACLCRSVEDADLPPLCFCGVLPGQLVSLDYCQGDCTGGCSGQGWTRMTTVTQAGYEGGPNTAFRHADQIDHCAVLLDTVIEMGIVRCFASAGDEGEPPTPSAYLEAVSLQMADMAAMQRAITCCLREATTRRVTLGPYTPIGPEGMCIGGLWQFVVAPY